MYASVFIAGSIALDLASNTLFKNIFYYIFCFYTLLCFYVCTYVCLNICMYVHMFVYQPCILLINNYIKIVERFVQSVINTGILFLHRNFGISKNKVKVQ